MALEDKAPIRLLGLVRCGPEELEELALSEKGERVLEPDVGSVTAVRPPFRPNDESRRNGVQIDVPRGRQEVLIRLDRSVVEMVAEEVAEVPMPLIPGAGVASKKLLHSG